MTRRTNLPWTQSTTREALRLQALGLKLGDIGQRLGFAKSTVGWRLKAVGNPGIIAKRRTRDMERRKNRQGKSLAVNIQHVPDHVEADRYARLTAPRSLTAMIFGDPPPGFSALARLTPDKLETLI